MKHFCICLLLFACCLPSFAKHILGGTIAYESLGPVANGFSYRIKVHLFRDCGVGNANFDMPNLQNVCIYSNTDNSLFMSINIPMIGTPSIVDNSYQPCIEEAYYATDVTLPASNKGYTFLWQRCCRNNTIINVETPDDMGFVLYMIIPPTNIVNSSPELTTLYPFYGNPSQFQHTITATDADNDAITYQLVAPLTTAYATPDNPIPVCMPALSSFLWLPFTQGYSLQNLLNSNTPLTINAGGQLNAAGIPIGNSVFGLDTRDYRNGVLISTTHSELSINIMQGYVGVENGLSAVEFHLSPNPASHSLQISLPNYRLKGYEIFSLEGKSLARGKESSIDISALAKGMYFMVVETEKGLGRQFFVKE